MLIAKTFAIGAELTNCIDSPGQSPVARAGGGRDVDGLRVALECVAITLSVRSLCGLCVCTAYASFNFCGSGGACNMPQADRIDG